MHNTNEHIRTSSAVGAAMVAGRGIVTVYPSVGWAFYLSWSARFSTGVALTTKMRGGIVSALTLHHGTEGGWGVEIGGEDGGAEDSEGE